MVKYKTFEFVETISPISTAVTKFGGQPVCLNDTQWPISKTTGKPMGFICQIELDHDLFPNAIGKMAYIFMTTDDEYVDETWEYEAGENAVIIQHGITPHYIKTVNCQNGPTLEQEYSISCQYGEDPEYIKQDELYKLEEEIYDKYVASVQSRNKIGGVPSFLQMEEFPDNGEWKLLLQLDSTKVPFYINFGGGGEGYLFINPQGTEGRFLWQC